MALQISDEKSNALLLRNNSYLGKPLAEVLNNGLMTVDDQWIVRRWNAGAEKIFSLPAANIIGKNIWEMMKDIVPSALYEAYQDKPIDCIPANFREYWGQKGAWFEGFTYCADGLLTVSFKSEAQPPSDQPRELPAQQLRTLNELYRYVTEVTNDCLWEWDLIGEMIFWIDGGHKRVLGYPIENAIVPQSFWESLLHPDDKPRILDRLARVFTDEVAGIWEEDYRMKGIEGNYVYLHERGHIIYEDGRPTRIIGASQDVTDRVKTELQLSKSERKLALITRQTVSAVLITDNKHNVNWVNESFSRITGYSEQEVMGQNALNYMHGDETGAASMLLLTKELAAHMPFDFEIESRRKDGQPYWLRLQSQPLFDKNGKTEGRFFLGTDITERVILERHLQRERQERLKEITAAVMSAQETERCELGGELHDNLNQILSVTKLYIQLAKANADKSEAYLDKANDFIGEVIEEIRRIAKTLVTPGLHEIGLFDSIRSLLVDLELDAIHFDFKVQKIRESEISEKLQLAIFRIVQEQVNNILKHSAASMATIVLSKVGEEIKLVISDDGKGSDPIVTHKGVGLLNIRSRAELHGGRVDTTSGLNKGFNLQVFFPLQPVEAK